MSSDESADDRRATTDPDTIERWARETRTVPVRASGRLRLVDEGEFDDDRHERLDWDAFEAIIAESDSVVVYDEIDRPDNLTIRDRDAVVEGFEGDDVDRRLRAGAVVTGTTAAFAPVAEPGVPEGDLESELVDATAVDQQVVDAELLSRECTNCAIEGETNGPEGQSALDVTDESYFDADSPSRLTDREDVSFEVEVAESWSLTVEVLEAFTVRSHRPDGGPAATETMADRGREANLDERAVHRHVLESDCFPTGFTDVDPVETETHAIESRIGERGGITTTVTQVRTVDREVGMDHRVTATGTDSERTALRTVHEEVVASTVADRDAAPAGGTRPEPVDRTSAPATDESTAVTHDPDGGGALSEPPSREESPTGNASGEELAEGVATDPGEAESRPGDRGPTDRTAEPPTPERTPTGDAPSPVADDADADPRTGVTLSAEDVGKSVVDETGTEVGVVTDVEGGRAVVDPRPSLTEKVMSRLGWGDADETDFRIGPERISIVDEEQVELRRRE
jgi:hypothetical protein